MCYATYLLIETLLFFFALALLFLRLRARMCWPVRLVLLLLHPVCSPESEGMAEDQGREVVSALCTLPIIFGGESDRYDVTERRKDVTGSVSRLSSTLIARTLKSQD